MVGGEQTEWEREKKKGEGGEEGHGSRKVYKRAIAEHEVEILSCLDKIQTQRLAVNSPLVP